MHEQSRYLPDANRVGVLAAVVLLTYALDHLVRAPGVTLSLQLPGFYFAYPLTLSAGMTLMASGLTATGMDWLLRGHPARQNKSNLEHWLVPTLTAFILGVLLDILPAGAAWWIGFALSAGILISVFLAEYISLDPGAPSYPLASAGLTALSYTLFFLLAISLRTSGARLFMAIPAVFFASSLVSLRTQHLRLGGRWQFPWALGVGIVCAQIAGGIHYWPLSPVQFGLILLGPLYALTALAYNLSEDIPARQALAEPAIILALAWGAAIFIR